MSKRNDALLIADMLLAISKIKTYTKGLYFDSFMADSRTVDAVLQDDLPELETQLFKLSL